MDADAFVNCAYVRQGEVNELINASPSERQDVIDDLLQLGKLEAYRGRARDARRGVQAVRDAQAERLDSLAEQITEYEDRDLHAELNALRTELSSVEADIDEFESNRETAEQTKEDAERVIEQYAEKRAELDDVEATIADLKETVTETEREREALSETVADARERVPGDLYLTLHADPFPGHLLARSGIDLDALAAHVDEFVVPLYDTAYGTTYWLESLASGFADRVRDLDARLGVELYAVDPEVDALADAAETVEEYADGVYFGYQSGNARAVLRRWDAEAREGVEWG
nr:hypothetical protein [Halarchaeum acidiphilum]